MPLFTWDPVEYTRNLDQYRTYVEDAAKYLSTSTGDPLDKCRKWVLELTGPNGTHPVKDPRVLYLTKETPGNREISIGTVSQYLKDVDSRKAILSPTMAVYINPAEKKSLLSEYILLNLAKRKKVKGEMFVAKMKGDLALEAFKNIVQTTFKIKNNSLSGAHASPSTPLFNKSSHSTLTSVCRSASGSANASNERFIAGNRHYYDVNVALSNITSIITHSNYDAINVAMDIFSLHYPTVEEVCAAIRYSTELYWRDESKFVAITELVQGMTAPERAAYLYTADFWHLKELNPGFVRSFLEELISIPTTPYEGDAKAVIGALDDDEFALVGLLCADTLAGERIYDLKTTDPTRYAIVASAAAYLVEVLNRYKCLYDAFWVTPNVPAAMASFPTSIRRSAIVSDTDSTIFTVQDWTIWYQGQLDFTSDSKAIAAIVVYFSSQVTKHVLATISGNMGVVPDMIHKLSMKNEYMFPVFVLTSRAKHYFAYKSAQEGNVLKELELEVKGVALKSSKVPKDIMDQSNDLLKSIMDDVIALKPIDIQATLKLVGDVERSIYNSIMTGECKYLTGARVNAESAYKNPVSSPFIHYGLWEEVFADKYGRADPPPYAAIKASVIANNKTQFNDWIATIPDRALAERLQGWADRNLKDKMTTVYLPANIVTTHGVPPEIAQIIDVRKIIFNAMESFYLILESLGCFIYTEDTVSLVMDRY